MLKKMKKVVTNNGIFNTDEVMAIATLSLAMEDLEIIRSRDPKVIDHADIVVDVGMKYDPSGGRFDHHQKDENLRRPCGEPYSSAGLVWKQFGREAIQRLFPTELSTDQIEKVWYKVDQNVIRGIDAADNRTRNLSGDIPALLFGSFISSLNPTWMEEKNDMSFNQAVGICSLALERAIASTAGQILAENEAMKALDDMKDGIVVLERYVPWQEYICRDESALFVVYEGVNGKQWNVQCVPVSPNMKKNRVPLPKSWAGLSGKELKEVTGIEGSVFCHKNRYIAAGKTREIAIKLAMKALLK